MSKTTNKSTLKLAIVDNMLDCHAAADCIEWLFEKYDEGEHNRAIETIRLLNFALTAKLSDALEMAEAIEAECGHA